MSELRRLIDDVEALGASQADLAAVLREMGRQYDINGIASALNLIGPS